MAIIPQNTPHTIIRHYQTSTDTAGHFMVHENLTVVHPPLRKDCYGCMHCKIYFILFSNHIRIVVTSANLVQEEWTKLNQVDLLEK